MPLHGPINLESVLKSSVYSTHRLQSWIIIDSSCSKIGQVVYKNSSQYKDDGFSSNRTLLRLNQRDSQSFVLILVLPKHLNQIGAKDIRWNSSTWKILLNYALDPYHHILKSQRSSVGRQQKIVVFSYLCTFVLKSNTHHAFIHQRNYTQVRYAH